MLFRYQALKFDCAIHAYVLMTNHVHLLLTAATAEGPSMLMKHLGQCYVQYLNRTHDRSSTLWEGRFKSRIGQEHDYFLRCHRYTDIQPWPAGRGVGAVPVATADRFLAARST